MFKKIPQDDVIKPGDILFYKSASIPYNNLPIIVLKKNINGIYIRYYTMFENKHCTDIIQERYLIEV